MHPAATGKTPGVMKLVLVSMRLRQITREDKMHAGGMQSGAVAR